LVQPKDIEGIIKCIKKLDNKECYKKTAIRNLKVSEEYDRSLLSEKIKKFLLEIKNEQTKRK
jgi:hypothetical protein